jgi:hypothetical protein
MSTASGRKILDKRLFSLATQDIPGAVVGNLKYKDKGKKKRDFYPTDDTHGIMNKYYNNESLG